MQLNWQLVTADVHQRLLLLSVQEAESRETQSFHCCTPDCAGWCIYQDDVNVFDCPVCGHANCLTCKAQHEGSTCRDYQDSLRARAPVDNAAKKTQKKIEVVFWFESSAVNSCMQSAVVMVETTKMFTLSNTINSDWFALCCLLANCFISFVILFVLFRSTPKSRPNNLYMGLRMSICPSIRKKFFRFRWNLVCR